MEKSLNLTIRDFQSEILEIVNKDKYLKLPIVIKQLVFNNIKNVIDEATEKVINKEINNFRQNINDKSEDETNEQGN